MPQRVITYKIMGGKAHLHMRHIDGRMYPIKLRNVGGKLIPMFKNIVTQVSAISKPRGRIAGSSVKGTPKKAISKKSVKGTPRSRAISIRKKVTLL
jgi:hypothetical protein